MPKSYTLMNAVHLPADRRDSLELKTVSIGFVTDLHASRPVALRFNPDGPRLDLTVVDAATLLRALKATLRAPAPAAQLERRRQITRLRSLARRLNVDTNQLHEAAATHGRMSDNVLDDLGHADLTGQLRMLYEQHGFGLAAVVVKAAAHLA